MMHPMMFPFNMQGMNSNQDKEETAGIFLNSAEWGLPMLSYKIQGK